MKPWEEAQKAQSNERMREIAEGGVRAVMELTPEERAMDLVRERVKRMVAEGIDCDAPEAWLAAIIRDAEQRGTEQEREACAVMLDQNAGELQESIDNIKREGVDRYSPSMLKCAKDHCVVLAAQIRRRGAR